MDESQDYEHTEKDSISQYETEKTVIKWKDRSCNDCNQPFIVHNDQDGVWVECDCDAGYVN